MKKIFLLTVVGGLGYFNSYSQTATATRRVDDPNGPQKVAETKKDNSLDAERKARLAKNAELKKPTSQAAMTEAEKIKISKEFEKKNSKKAESTKSAKGNPSTLTPVKRN